MYSNHQLPDPHGKIIGHGNFKYKVDCHWGELDRNEHPIENCHSLAMTSDGNIVMVTDHPEKNIYIYAPDGTLLDSFGTMFPGAHSVKVNNEDGIDYLYIVESGWITNRHWNGVSTDDWGSPANKVIQQAGFIAKTTLNGRLIFTISHPQTIGVYSPEMPFNPTDIAIAPNGDLYVSDGYGSDFILHYNKNGQYINHFGGNQNDNSCQNLANAHGIELDLREPNTPKLIISSRAEQSLKQFSLNGEHINTIEVPGAWIHAPLFHKNHFYSASCWSDIDGKNVEHSGFISIFDKDNRLVANLGANVPEYEQGKLQALQTDWQVFSHCHGICLDNEGNIYVGQWRANQCYPWKLERI